MLFAKNCSAEIPVVKIPEKYLWSSYPFSKVKIKFVVVITTAQLHSTKPELRFCAEPNPAHGVSEIRDGEDL